MIKTQEGSNEKVRVGIIANEFFHKALGGMGGFGWSAKEAAKCLKTENNYSIEPIFITGIVRPKYRRIETRIHGIPLMFAETNWEKYVKTLRNKNIDVLLTIDYRPNYDLPIYALEDVPVIVWIGAPYTRDDFLKLNTLRIPGSDSIRPRGTESIDTSSLCEVVNKSRLSYRPVLFASPSLHHWEKAEEAYNLKILQLDFLPYPIPEINLREISKSKRPRVIFLGRLDPTKRPWVFMELASRFPQVEFIMLGKAHYHGSGAWTPGSVPKNVSLLGHIEGERKFKILSSAWILVNSSIHEGLPVSFVEALQHEVPIVSSVNPEGLVSRYGYYTGTWAGTGLDGIQHFVKGLKVLLENRDLRIRLGKEGRNWVEQNHNQRKFLKAFRHLHESAQGKRMSLIPKSRNSKQGQNHIPDPPKIFSKYDRRYRTKEKIEKYTNKGEYLILVDEELFRNELNNKKYAIPFLEIEGKYWGLPPDDETAIRELKRLRKSGAKSIIFASASFWWLDHYTMFHEYLRSNFKCVEKTEYLVTFDLK